MTHGFSFQPGVVSTCNVTERISFVNNCAAVFGKGVFQFFFFKKGWSIFCGTFPKVWGAVIATIFSRTPNLRFSTLTVFLILHVSDERWIPALVVHGGSEASLFPCTARLN